MKTKAILLALISIAFIACKKTDETKSTIESTEIKEERVVKEFFSIEVTANASKKDDFAVYYTTDNTDNYTPEKAVWRSISGDNKDEILYFDFSQEIIPTNIRFDFGINKEQDSVEIKNIRVSFYENYFDIKGSEFFNYFATNPEFKTEIDPTNGSLKILKNGSEYKTPFYYPNPGFLAKLKENTIGK